MAFCVTSQFDGLAYNFRPHMAKTRASNTCRIRPEADWREQVVHEPPKPVGIPTALPLANYTVLLRAHAMTSSTHECEAFP